jgi:hypothetical protein
MTSRILANLPRLALALPLLVACNVESLSAGDRGVGDTETYDGVCPNGVTVLLSDYSSTLITLGSLDGTTKSSSFLSTGSSGTDGLSFALSGDVVLPSSRPDSRRVVLIDRFGTNVITWADPRNAQVLGQLAVGTGFESNPSDYLELDSGEAFVTRWGENGDPGRRDYDRGGDVLLLDSAGFAITGAIELPHHDDLPARPSNMIRLGDRVLVTLDRISLDFASTGDSELVAISLADHAVKYVLSFAGLKGCGRPALSPSGAVLAVACSGALTRTGTVPDPSQSALVLLDTSVSPPAELRRLAATTLLAGALQNDVVFASENLLLFKSQTELSGADNNRWLSLNLADDQLQTLLEARHDGAGKGRGLVYGGMSCAPGCSDVCLLADADRGVLQRVRVNDTQTELLPSIQVENRIGLPPRDLTLR